MRSVCALNLAKYYTLTTKCNEININQSLLFFTLSIGQYRRIDELIHETHDKGHLELLDLKEVKDLEEEFGET